VYLLAWQSDSVRFDVMVEVRLRQGIADPQGATIERALPALGFTNITGVGVGKAIRFAIDAADEPTARAQVGELCHRFLTNPVIEDAVVRIGAEAAGGTLALGADEIRVAGADEVRVAGADEVRVAGADEAGVP
jgi:phosphoribosylformylglycinamidine synthase